MKLLKHDEPTHIDQLVQLLETEMQPSEILAASFELELSGKIRQMPGRIL
jgi:DNA processing protein